MPTIATCWRRPWTLEVTKDAGTSMNGPFFPLLIEVEGPMDAVAFMEQNREYQAKVQLCLQDIDLPQLHAVVPDEGRHYSSGDAPAPGVFMVVGAHPDWNTSDGGALGAGHVFVHGWEWTGLVCKLKNDTAGQQRMIDIAKQRNQGVLGAASRVFSMLKAVAGARREARFGGGTAPGSTYFPSYTNGSLVANQEDPRQVFLEYLWKHFMTKDGDRNLDMALCADRNTALDTMIQRKKSWFGGTAGTANRIFAAAHGDLAPETPALKKLQGSTTCVLGSSQLIGEWRSHAGITAEGDWCENCQNWSQILHLNQGMGWEKLVGDDPAGGQKSILVGFYDAMTDPTLSDDERKKRFVLKIKQLKAMQLPDSAVELMKKLNIELTEATPPVFAAMIFDICYASLSKTDLADKWKELVDLVVCARGFTKNGEPAPLSFYIAYEIASGEGFHVFGHDPLSDIIATEGGRRFAEEMRRPDSAISNKETVGVELEAKLADARTAFIEHPVWGRRKRKMRAEKAFYSLFVAVDATGALLPTVKNGGHHIPTKVVWDRTFSTLLSSTHFTNEYKADPAALLTALEAHLTDPSKRQTAFALNGNEVITGDRIAVMNEMIEVLMLLAELPEN